MESAGAGCGPGGRPRLCGEEATGEHRVGRKAAPPAEASSFRSCPERSASPPRQRRSPAMDARGRPLLRAMSGHVSSKRTKAGGASHLCARDGGELNEEGNRASDGAASRKHPRESPRTPPSGQAGRPLPYAPASSNQRTGQPPKSGTSHLRLELADCCWNRRGRDVKSPIAASRKLRRRPRGRLEGAHAAKWEARAPSHPHSSLFVELKKRNRSL